MPIPAHREGPTGYDWMLCPECGREAEWDEHLSDDSSLQGEIVLVCTRCKLEGRVRRDQAQEVPVVWSSRDKRPHRPELEGLIVGLAHVPAGVEVTLTGPPKAILEHLAPGSAKSMKLLFPEVFF